MNLITMYVVYTPTARLNQIQTILDSIVAIHRYHSDMSSNMLTGTIPATLGSYYRLTYLYVQ